MMVEYGQRLAVVMEAEGLEGKEIAEKLRVSPSYISQCLNGKRLVNTELIHALREVFRVRPEFMHTGMLPIKESEQPLYPSEVGNRGEIVGTIRLPNVPLRGTIEVEGVEYEITGTPKRALSTSKKRKQTKD